MTEIYTQPGCLRCKKAKQWMKENEIQYTERSLYGMLLDPAQRKALLKESQVLLEGVHWPQAARPQEWESLLMQTPSIMARPLFAADDQTSQDDLEKITKYVTNHEDCPVSCPILELCASSRKGNQMGLYRLLKEPDGTKSGS